MHNEKDTINDIVPISLKYFTELLDESDTGSQSEGYQCKFFLWLLN